MKQTTKILGIMLALVLSISMIPTISVSAAKKVKLNKTKATIYVGKTVTLKLKNNKKKVKWSSSNKKVATVIGKGKVKGKKAGKATITAEVGKKKYRCKITVKKKKHSWDNVQVVIPDTIGDDDDRTERVKILDYWFADDGYDYYSMYIKFQYVHTSKFYAEYGWDTFGTPFYCYDSQGNMLDSGSCFLFIMRAYLNQVYMDDALIPKNTAKIVFMEYPII